MEIKALYTLPAHRPFKSKTYQQLPARPCSGHRRKRRSHACRGRLQLFQAADARQTGLVAWETLSSAACRKESSYNLKKNMEIGKLILFLFFFLQPLRTLSELYMVVEYNTNGTVKRNSFNITMQTVNLNIKILGCDEGYFEGWNGTTLACEECICDVFESTRLEPFQCT
jgi:hypothetical protein